MTYGRKARLFQIYPATEVHRATSFSSSPTHYKREDGGEGERGEGGGEWTPKVVKYLKGRVVRLLICQGVMGANLPEGVTTKRV